MTNLILAGFGNQVIEICSTIGIAVKNSTTYEFDYWSKYQRYFHNELPTKTREVQKELKIKEYTYQEISLDPKYAYKISNHFFLDNREYWQSLQSWKYFDHCLETARYYFEPHFDIDTDFLKDAVSIHIRRGDYVGHPLYVNLGKEYYQNAIKQFPDRTKFIIFTDDKDFVIKNYWFSGKSAYIWYASEYQLSVPENVVDWVAMRNCTGGHIIANSSFSLSCAYLADEISKVVAPKNWFSGRLIAECPTTDLYKPDWILL